MELDRLALLRRNALLQGLGDRDLEELLKICAVARLPAGRKLLEEGGNSRGMLMIAEGDVEVSRTGAEGERTVVATLGPGEIIGELSLIDGRPHSARVVATSEVLLYRLDRSGFQDLRERRRPVAFELLHRIADTICRRMRDMTQRITHGAAAVSPHSLPASAGRRLAKIGPRERALVARQRHFRDLSGSELDELLAVMEAFHLPKRTMVCQEGQAGGACYLVLSGGIEVLVRKQGRDEGLVVLKPGALFGQVALFDRGPRSATCRAYEDSTLLQLRRPAFEYLLEQRSAGAWRFLDALVHVLAGQLRRATEQFRLARETDRRQAQRHVSRLTTSDRSVDGFLRRARAGLGDFDLDEIEVIHTGR